MNLVEYPRGSTKWAVHQLKLQHCTTISEADVKAAFRSLALILHPDKNPQNPQEAEQRFVELQLAYERALKHAQTEQTSLGKVTGQMQAFESRVGQCLDEQRAQAEEMWLRRTKGKGSFRATAAPPPPAPVSRAESTRDAPPLARKPLAPSPQRVRSPARSSPTRAVSPMAQRAANSPTRATQYQPYSSTSYLPAGQARGIPQTVPIRRGMSFTKGLSSQPQPSAPSPVEPATYRQQDATRQHEGAAVRVVRRSNNSPTRGVPPPPPRVVHVPTSGSEVQVDAAVPTSTRPAHRVPPRPAFQSVPTYTAPTFAIVPDVGDSPISKVAGSSRWSFEATVPPRSTRTPAVVAPEDHHHLPSAVEQQNTSEPLGTSANAAHRTVATDVPPSIDAQTAASEQAKLFAVERSARAALLQTAALSASEVYRNYQAVATEVLDPQARMRAALCREETVHFSLLVELCFDVSAILF